MKRLYRAFIALITVAFLSTPTISAPVELHYWHGHTGKLEAIINERINGRGERIRTFAPLVPNQVRYQAALLPENGLL